MNPVSPPSIYIVGAQSTGKTTLVNALQEHFAQTSPDCGSHPIPPPRIIREVARGLLQKHSFTALDIATSPSKALQFQQLVLHAQNEAEQATERDWFISDRSCVDAAVYAERFGDQDALHTLMGEQQLWKDILERMQSGVIVVCEPGVQWLVDDGTRLMPKTEAEWLQVHDTFCHRLEYLELEFSVLSREVTALEARVAFVVHLWEQGVASVTSRLEQEP